MEQSLYQRMGGEAAILATVTRFYEKVIADELTRPYFEGLDMTALARKQLAFMTVAFGGPVQNRGKDLTEAHAALVKEKGLSDVHFDRIAVHLKAALEDARYRKELVDEVMQLIAGTRGQVLGR